MAELASAAHPDDSRYMEALQLAGRIIMENGGETFRAEETITRMGRAFGLDQVECFAIPSGLFITYRKSDRTLESGVLRIRKGGTNFSRVDAANTVSRQVEAHTLTFGEALERLRAIHEQPAPLGPVGMTAAAALCGGAFAVMFGGGAVDFFSGALAAALAQVIAAALERVHSSGMVVTLAGSLVAALLPLMLYQFTRLGIPEASIAGALMPLLPGLAMTNAVQDAMRGDVVSSLSSGMTALITAALIAAGVLIASACLGGLAGGALPC